MSKLPPSPKRNLWQWLGQPLAWLYGLGAWLHRASYVYGPFRQASFEPLVICIGNLSLGGTGKSPHVLYIQGLLGQVEHTAMISRGYGRKSKGVQGVTLESIPEEVGDEALQFKQAYPEATVVVAEKRAEGIKAALAKQPHLHYILLDDAFQHWGVQASCYLLLTTFKEPFFQQEVLPIGPLREFRRGYQRAEVIIVTKCPPQITAATRAAYIQAINPLPNQKVLFSWLVYQPLYELLEGKAGPSLEQPQALLLLTAIASTQALETHLEEHQLSCLKFPDHHLFSKKDLYLIKEKGQGRTILTTEKDATKLCPLLKQYPEIQLTIYVLPIKVALSTADETWLLSYLTHKKIPTSTPTSRNGDGSMNHIL